MRFKLILFLVLLVMFTIFVVQNTEPVNLQFFFWRIEELPKIVLLIITMVLGVVLGVLISALISRKKKNDKGDIDKEKTPEIKNPKL